MTDHDRKPTKPVVLPHDYTLNHASSNFEDPARGQCSWHTLLSNPFTPTSCMSAGIAYCPPSTGSLALHRHTQAEIYHVTAGKGVVVIDGVRHDVQKGSTVFIPGDAEHGVLCEGSEELEWFFVFPTGSFEDVVYRFSHEQGAGEGKVKAKL